MSNITWTKEENTFCRSMHIASVGRYSLIACRYSPRNVGWECSMSYAGSPPVCATVENLATLRDAKAWAEQLMRFHARNRKRRERPKP